MDWGKIERMEVKPPFVPKISDDPKDTSNFHHEFTKEAPTLSPTSPGALKTINQEDFQGFTYTADDLQV